MSKQWYVGRDQKQSGPYSWEELVEKAKSGEVGKSDLVWSEGLENWIAAEKVEGLFTFSAESPPPIPSEYKSASPPSLETSRQGSDDTVPPAAKVSSRELPKKKSGLKIALIVIASLVALLVIFFVVIFASVRSTLRSSEVYAQAMSTLQSNPEAVQMLGSPVEAKNAVSGSINVSNGSGDAELSIPVSGSIQKGDLIALAEKNSGQWQIYLLELQLQNGESLNLLLDAPAYVGSGGLESTSIGGAIIEMGYDFNDDLSINSPRTSFASGENFYISFYNNEPFNSNIVTFQLYFAETDEFVNEIIYDDIEPQWGFMVTEPVYVNGHGKYTFKAVVNGIVRATQDIIIEGSEDISSEMIDTTIITGKMNDFNEYGISFSYPDYLASGVTVKFLEGLEPYYPDYAICIFNDFVYTESIETPGLQIFLVDEYIAISEYASLQTNELKKYISDVNSISGVRELPYLPELMAGQQFYSNAVPISFQNGKGIRYITQYVQDISPVTNDGLFYTFQGLTDDGIAYVSFTMPLFHPDLPANYTDFFDSYEVTYEAFDDNYQEYLTLVVDMIHETDDDIFTPSLRVIDDIIMSLQLD